METQAAGLCDAKDDIALAGAIWTVGCAGAAVRWIRGLSPVVESCAHARIFLDWRGELVPPVSVSTTH